MSSKIMIVWLILLTAWVGFDAWNDHKNLQLRNRAVKIRAEKFEEIDGNFETVNGNFESLDARFKSLVKYINGPLKDEIARVNKYSHKH